MSRRHEVAECAFSALVVVLVALAMAWLDAPARRASPTGLQITVTADRAEDLRSCQQQRGPQASVVYLPDGQHRCTGGPQ